MTEEEYREYYSRVVTFILPFPITVDKMTEYLDVLPNGAVVLATNVNHFNKCTEILIRHESFPKVGEGVCPPRGSFRIKRVVGEDGNTIFEIPFDWIIGRCNETVVIKDSLSPKKKSPYYMCDTDVEDTKMAVEAIKRVSANKKEMEEKYSEFS